MQVMKTPAICEASKITARISRAIGSPRLDTNHQNDEISFERLLPHQHGGYEDTVVDANVAATTATDPAVVCDTLPKAFGNPRILADAFFSFGRFVFVTCICVGLGVKYVGPIFVV